jgi:hypothetical protein
MKRNAKWHSMAKGCSRQFGKWEQRARAQKRSAARSERYRRRKRHWATGHHDRWMKVGREALHVERYGDADEIPF